MDVEFTATLETSPAKAGWTYVVWPEIGKEAGDSVRVRLLERIETNGV